MRKSVHLHNDLLSLYKSFQRAQMSAASFKHDRRHDAGQSHHTMKSNPIFFEP